MARYIPLFYRGAPASIPQVVAHIQRTLTEEDPGYTPLRQRMPPASIPEIVAHIQEYLTANVFVTVEDLGSSIAQYIEAHPEIVGVLTVNGSSGNVALDASDIPIETGEDPTVAGAISYLSSQLALLVAGAVMSVNGVDPDDSHDVTLTGAEIPQDGNTMKKLSETFGPATSSTAGSKGLVPAPAAGDENKVLSGAGTWVVNQSAGGVTQVCGVSPNAQGNVPLKGSDIPLQSMSLQTVSQAIAAVGTAFTGATSSTAGAKGQVPAPAAGDEDKVLSGGGTWVTPASGTVKQVCSVSPDAQGNVSLTGSNVPTSTTDNTPISSTLSSLNDHIGRLGRRGEFLSQWTWGIMLNGWGFIIPFVNCNIITISTVKVLVDGSWASFVLNGQSTQNSYLFSVIQCTVPTGVVLENGKVYLAEVAGTAS